MNAQQQRRATPKKKKDKRNVTSTLGDVEVSPVSSAGVATLSPEGNRESSEPYYVMMIAVPRSKDSSDSSTSQESDDAVFYRLSRSQPTVDTPATTTKTTGSQPLPKAEIFVSCRPFADLDLLNSRTNAGTSSGKVTASVQKTNSGRRNNTSTASLNSPSVIKRKLVQNGYGDALLEESVTAAIATINEGSLASAGSEDEDPQGWDTAALELGDSIHRKFERATKDAAATLALENDQRHQLNSNHQSIKKAVTDTGKREKKIAMIIGPFESKDSASKIRAIWNLHGTGIRAHNSHVAANPPDSREDGMQVEEDTLRQVAATVSSKIECAALGEILVAIFKLSAWVDWELIFDVKFSDHGLVQTPDGRIMRENVHVPEKHPA